MPLSAKRRAALIFNPAKVDEQALRSVVAAESRRAGWGAPGFFPTSIEDPGAGVTQTALEDGFDALLVAGGDGTVRTVAGAIAGTGIPLTIVPSGTGNLFARNLGLPLNNPAAAIRPTFEGTVHPVDIGWARATDAEGGVAEHPFVVLAGIGLDASMIANTRDDLKKAVGWVAYVEAAARALPKAKPVRVVFQLDEGKLRSTRVQSMLFANCGSLPAGIALIPNASVIDGRLDVVVLQPRGAFGWLKVWQKIWWDNSVLLRTTTGRRVLHRRGQNTAVRYLHGSSIETALAVPTAAEVDGDEIGEVTRIECRVDAGALLLSVPPGHDVDGL